MSIVKRGVCIQLCAVNNSGKSTQLRLLVQYLREKGLRVSYFKFPLYEGEQGRLNQLYLKDAEYRKKFQREHPDAEILVAKSINQGYVDMNERFEKLLASGEWIIMEGGILDVVVWSIIHGMSEEEIFSDMTQVKYGDVGILLNEKQGRRFVGAIEKGHLNEENEVRTQEARLNMLRLKDKVWFPYVQVDFEIDEPREVIFERLLKSLRQHVDILQR